MTLLKASAVWGVGSAAGGKAGLGLRLEPSGSQQTIRTLMIPHGYRSVEASPPLAWTVLVSLVAGVGGAVAIVERGQAGATGRFTEPDGLAGSDSQRVVHALTDRELCLAWQISTLALTELKHRGDIANQAAMIRLRQCYLDEFSSRRRIEFDHWLSAGAWPSGDPPA